MTSKNPFATPSSTPESSQPATNDWLARLLPNAKATFLRWERWRLIYCTVCIIATSAFMFLFDKIPGSIFPEPPPAQPLNSWIEFIFAGIVANFCYIVGPVVDTYADWLGFKSRWIGIALFGMGTAFTVLAAFFAVSGVLN